MSPEREETESRETEMLIAELRSLEPPLGVDPAWDQMAREISAACDAVGMRRRSRVVTWLGETFRPRNVAIGLVGAIAAIALIVLVRGGNEQQARRSIASMPDAPLARRDAGAEDGPATTNEARPTLRAAAIDELDGLELETLAASLIDPSTVFDEGAEQDEPLDDAELVLGPDPNYESLLDELDDEDIDELDAVLTRDQPG